jgi:ACS family tartrate transporter-like MFS transporter
VEPVAPARDLRAVVVSRLTWRLVPFLFLLYIVAYLDRINVGFAALQMQAQLGFSDAVYGLGAGIFFAGYFLFQVPSNLVLDRLGARRWIAALMTAWGVVSCCMALVTTERSFYLLRFLLGAAEAGFFPGVILYLRNWFPPAARARTVARFMTAAPLSGVVGGPVSGALLDLHSKGGLSGWQWMFLLEGLPAVLLGAVVLFYLSDGPGNARWLRDDERGWLAGALDEEKRQGGGPGTALPLAALRSGKVWLLAFAYFALNNCSYGISLWLPKVIRGLTAVSNFELGLLSAIPYVLAAGGMVWVGQSSDRTGERRWHLAGSALVGGAALLLAAGAVSIAPALAGISVGVLGTFAMMGPFWATATGHMRGAAAAAGIALVNSIGNLGGFSGPYIVGLTRTSTGGFKAGLLMVGAALLVSGLTTLLVRPSAPEAATPP